LSQQQKLDGGGAFKFEQNSVLKAINPVNLVQGTGGKFGEFAASTKARRMTNLKPNLMR